MKQNCTRKTPLFACDTRVDTSIVASWGSLSSLFVITGIFNNNVSTGAKFMPRHVGDSYVTYRGP